MTTVSMLTSAREGMLRGTRRAPAALSRSDSVSVKSNLGLRPPRPGRNGDRLSITYRVRPSFPGIADTK
jgi:hypothetical protein